ncbi:PREDICTED: uncharacterized protein LOC105359960 [Ceratosolen solmsi marchali]|uniref:Uncharacterized protein LOC105359960 n=1 Tax=Ceratosolen solmsi marchali TaxID=326594 RepID=A0AAJ6VML3_9HYME|nr:PREDICTED: uncharacterized protein LOC105359960 [Ceratosolen solmsi marchali]
MTPTSIKVKRSNSQSLGTYDQNFESSNYHLASQPTLKSKGIANHNKDQDALSQVHHITYSNQITPPYFQSFLNQPNIANKFNTISRGTEHKSLAKHQYKFHPEYTEFPSSVPVYHSMVQIPIQTITTNHHNPIQQAGSQYAPYTAQLVQNLRALEPVSKNFTPLNRNIHQQPYHQHQLNTYFQNIDHQPFSNVQYSTLPKVEINGKKITLPILQLQANQQFPGYVQTIEPSPVIFSSENALQYKTNPNFDISVDFIQPKNINNNLRTNLNIPVTSLPYNYGSRLTQILPLRSSSSTAQFPKFKGASIGQLPNRASSKYPNDYQEFKLQTQLHFNGNLNNKPNNIIKHELYKRPLEEIRTDVEVINKKKPIPPLPKDDDDDDDDESSENGSDEGLKNTDSYFPKYEYDEFPGLSRKYVKLSHLQGDFYPSKLVPLINNDDDEEDDDENVNLAAKYRYRVKSNYDDDGNLNDDEERDSVEDASQSKYTTQSTQEKFENQSSNENSDQEEDILQQDKREKIVAFDQAQKKYNIELDKTFRKKQNKFNPPSHQIKDYVKSEETQDPPYVKHWMDDKLEMPGKSSKRTQYNYHDANDDPSIKSSSLSSSIRHFPQNDKLFDSVGHDKSQTISKKIKSPQIVWQESYGLNANSRVDEREYPTLRKKKSEDVISPAKTRKLPQERLAILSFKASTNVPKQLIKTDSGSSALSSHPLWKFEDTYTRSSKPTPRSLVQMKQDLSDSLSGHAEIYSNSKQT